MKTKQTYQDGARYEGEMKRGKREGYGVMTYTDGHIYRGEWKDDRRHGNGTMTWPDGRHFEGVWSNDYPARGKHTWPDGDSYDGTWNQWNREGYGVMTYSDGVYTGEWKNNARCGKGSVHLNNGNSYEGEWYNDKKHGQGIYCWADGTRYEGQWKDNVQHGIGRFAWPDGEVYAGELVNGRKEGDGTYRYRDGSSYSGRFHDNKRNGSGTLTYPDGRTQTGEWRDDVFVTAPTKPQEQKKSAPEKPVESAYTEALLCTGDYLVLEEAASASAYPAALRGYFSTLIGMDEVKTVIANLYSRFVYDQNREKLLGTPAGKKGYNFVITGNPGTGKTTVARILSMLLCDIGILPEAKLVETDRSGLVAEHIGGTAKRTAQVIDSARGGALFIDEAYSLYVEESKNDFGVEAINTLLKDMEDHRGEYAVILAGYKEEMRNMLRKANPGFASRFDYIIDIPDYSAQELLQMIVKQARDENYVIENAAQPVILKKLKAQMLDSHFDNGRYARKLLDQAKNTLAARVMSLPQPEKKDFQVLKAGDFGVEEREDQQLQSYLDELDSLIGLDSVKEQVHKLINTVKVKKAREARNLGGGTAVSLNMVFTGNPGTGKTTVARLLGNIYYELGLLRKKDCFVECSRVDLVGQYLGQTAPRVKDKVEEALGGILFIDEAYTLLNDERDSFGMEAINTLVPLIENHRDNLVVILAGYTKEMDHFLAANPGLRSRVSRTIDFPDYSIAELTEIFVRSAQRGGYKLDVDLGRLYGFIAARKAMAADFGNARGVRNLFGEVISNLEQRIAAGDLSRLSDDDIVTIRDEDLR